MSSPDDLRAMEYVRVRVNDGDVAFNAAQQALKALMAVDEMLASLGWIVTVDAEDFATEDMKCVRLLRRPGALAMLHEDMVYCLAPHLFLARIRDWADVGRNPSLHCKIKLWGSWIWEGHVDVNVTMEHT